MTDFAVALLQLLILVGFTLALLHARTQAQCDRVDLETASHALQDEMSKLTGTIKDLQDRVSNLSKGLVFTPAESTYGGVADPVESWVKKYEQISRTDQTDSLRVYLRRLLTGSGVDYSDYLGWPPYLAKISSARVRLVGGTEVALGWLDAETQRSYEDAYAYAL